MTDLKPEDLVKLREIAEKAPGQDGWGLFAKGATLSISRNGAAPSQSIDMVHWSGFDGSSLRVKADRKALAKHIATFDPPTVLSLLADRARMEKALRETNDALLNAAAALEQLQESSENGAESIKTIGTADPGVTVHMFRLLADSARRAAKYAREGASQ